MQEAIHAYTAGTAYINGCENRTGSVDIGKRADLVAMSLDPYSVTPEEFLETEVKMTVSAGQIVHRKI